MFLPVSFLCATVSIFSSYIFAVPLQDQLYATGSEEVYEKGSTTTTRSERWIRLVHELDTEYLTMADGFHLKFPLSGKHETDQQQKTISIAVSKLAMNLKTMEQAGKVIMNVISDLDLNNTELFLRFDFGEQPSETMMRNFSRDFFIALNYQMETDKELRDEYKKRVNESREIVRKDPKMNGPLIKVWEESSSTSDSSVQKFLEDKKTYRRSYLNGLFFWYSNENVVDIVSPSDHESIDRCYLVRALIQIAVTSQSTESKVNDIYQRALIEADKGQLDVETSADSLFDSLEKALKLDPVLYEEVESLKKQIEKEDASTWKAI